MNKTYIIILGAGGDAASIIWALEGYHWQYSTAKWNDPCLGVLGSPLEISFIDPAYKEGERIHGKLVIAESDDDLPELRKSLGGDVRAVINSGWIRQPADLRKGLWEKCQKAGVPAQSVISLASIVDREAPLEDSGVQIRAGAYLGPDTTLGKNILINTGAIVSHGCIIHSHTHIAPGAVLAGDVEIGRCCLIGMGATIYKGRRIGDGVTVANGQNVFRDIPGVS